MSAEESEEGEKKLPYFHRELDANDAALLGKNVPQVIASGADKTATDADAKLTTASAWNAAQSWEERDATKKCIECLKDLMDLPASFAEFGEDSGTGIIITACDDVTGNANVTHSRGKVRYMYEFNITLKFEVEVSGTTYSGKINCLDMANDQDEDDYSVAHEWTGNRPANAAGGDKIRKSLDGMQFKEALKAQMTLFEKRFREMFQ
jgi:hypothetical protein